MIFVDSNVVIDLIEAESRWSPWAFAAVGKAGAESRLVANLIVLAETARRFADLREQRDYLQAVGIEMLDLPAEAAFRAGKAYQTYRQVGGDRQAIIADFLIGGHAAALAAALITRDRRRFAFYFPELTLITPETDHG